MKCPEKVTVKKEEDNWFIGILKLEFWQKDIFSENTCDPQEYKSEQTEMQRYISYFWGCIIRTPTTCLQKLTITHDVTQTKVCNLHTSPFGMQKQILRLQISMHHLIAVAVLHACYNLQVFQKNIAVMNSSGCPTVSTLHVWTAVIQPDCPVSSVKIEEYELLYTT